MRPIMTALSHITVTSMPSLKDLYEKVTPEYATFWKTIGVLLELPTEELNIIEQHNNAKAVSCCNAMFQKWLETDPSASWKRLLEAIESPAVDGTNKGTIIYITL